VDPETGAIQTVYLPGDSCLAVLRDLKRLWRKDDTDDERTVFRCFHRCHLARELVALIEECVGRGDHERKIALAATDLLAALTWPIDVAQELKELAEDDADIVTDYASLLRAQVEYKALLLKSNTLLRVMQLVIPCLARVSAGSNSSKFGILDRQGIEKDKRIVSLMLHLARNLLAIRDPIANGQETGEKQELSTLQVSRLDKQLGSCTLTILRCLPVNTCGTAQRAQISQSLPLPCVKCQFDNIQRFQRSCT
jgi:replication fork protection complex subunit Tof1/Swi1